MNFHFSGFMVGIHVFFLQKLSFLGAGIHKNLKSSENAEVKILENLKEVKNYCIIKFTDQII